MLKVWASCGQVDLFVPHQAICLNRACREDARSGGGPRVHQSAAYGNKSCASLRSACVRHGRRQAQAGRPVADHGLGAGLTWERALWNGPGAAGAGEAGPDEETDYGIALMLFPGRGPEAGGRHLWAHLSLASRSPRLRRLGWDWDGLCRTGSMEELTRRPYPGGHPHLQRGHLRLLDDEGAHFSVAYWPLAGRISALSPGPHDLRDALTW